MRTADGGAILAVQAWAFSSKLNKHMQMLPRSSKLQSIKQSAHLKHKIWIITVIFIPLLHEQDMELDY